jgi:hypothetical protein
MLLNESRFASILLCLSVSVCLCRAQFPTPSHPPDTAAGRTNRPADSLLIVSGRRDTAGGHQTKSPWLAVGLSAALPGLGQIYNRSYWKVPLIWGLGGYWVYEWVHLNNNYRDFRDQYAGSISPSLPGGNNQFLQLRDFYRDERDRFAWYLGALYLLNLIDAYVGANLFDFDVGPDLTAGGRGVPQVRASLRFPF